MWLSLQRSNSFVIWRLCRSAGKVSLVEPIAISTQQPCRCIQEIANYAFRVEEYYLNSVNSNFHMHLTSI